MLEPNFPILRHRVIQYAPGFGVTEKELRFNNPYLIVAFHCPEVIPEHERAFNNKNLKPYEHCVNRYAGSDFLYDLAEVQSAGTRTVYNCDMIENNSASVGNDVVIIVSYLEFHT